MHCSKLFTKRNASGAAYSDVLSGALVSQAIGCAGVLEEELLRKGIWQALHLDSPVVAARVAEIT